MKTIQRFRLMAGAAALLFVMCLSVEHLDARGGGGRGGGFGGGRGGGFGGSRGGFGGGSVRQSRGYSGGSMRPSRDYSAPGRSRDVGSSSSRMSGGYGDHGSVRQSDRMASPRPDTGDRYSSFQRGGQSRDVQRPSQGGRFTNADLGGNRPAAGQQPAKSRSDLRQERKQQGTRLSDDQKSKLREKYADSGLKPSQLPSDERKNWQDNRDERREDWQEWRDDAREDWQDWYEDEYEDYWDDYYWGYSPWWYGYPVGGVSYTFYINDTPPCANEIIVSQAGGVITYYNCSSTWYRPITSTTGSVKYVVSSPPAGSEVTSLRNPTVVTVNGWPYYLSGHVFYQKITRGGTAVYVTVDAPVGARVPTIPEYAVEVQHNGQSYYRVDQTFYQKQGDSFTVVKNPGV